MSFSIQLEPKVIRKEREPRIMIEINQDRSKILETKEE